MRYISDHPSVDADVIVVGAGFAGITAARELAQAGTTVAVLEARTRVGGRALSRPIGGGKVVDLGCEFHGQDDSISASAARSVGVGSQKVYDQGNRLIEFGGRLVPWQGAVPRVGVTVLADFGQAALRLERMAREVPPQAPWLAPHARRWDSQTMWSWARRNLGTRGGRELMRVTIEGSLAAGMADVSLLHVLNYSNGLGGFRAMASVTGGALENRFAGGAQGLASRLAEGVSEHTYLGAVVRRISHAGDHVRVSGAGFEAVGRRVVVAVPVPLAGRIEYDPPLPAYRDQLSQRLIMGSVIKYVALYDESFWRAAGLTGQVISPTSLVRAVLDGGPPDGTPGVLSAFVAGPAARGLGSLPEPERRGLVLREFGRFFGPRASRPYDFIEQNWMAETYTRGCYHGYAPPGLYTSYGPALKEPIGRIHWAGAETVPIEFGSMSGAIHSGRRVAAEILARQADAGPEMAATAERPPRPPA